MASLAERLGSIIGAATAERSVAMVLSCSAICLHKTTTHDVDCIHMVCIYATKPKFKNEISQKLNKYSENKEISIVNTVKLRQI